MHRRSLIAAAVVLPALAAVPLRAKGRGRVFALDGLALGGTDPVAYFAAGAPQPGRKELALKWGGAVWQFASESNRTAFEMNPRAYAPQYGGHCALAMAEGRVAASVPEAFTVHEGRLYLNASLDDRTIWRQDIAGNIARADRNWPAVLG